MAEWWAQEGFRAEPTPRVSMGSETIFRAFGGSSRPINKCFFAPVDDRKHLILTKITADDLEIELNVALWGNAISTIGVFRLHSGVSVFEGEVAQNLPSRDWVSFVGAGVPTLKQIWIASPVDQKVTMLDMFPVRQGAYHVPRGAYASGFKKQGV